MPGYRHRRCSAGAIVGRTVRSNGATRDGGTEEIRSRRTAGRPLLMRAPRSVPAGPSICTNGSENVHVRVGRYPAPTKSPYAGADGKNGKKGVCSPRLHPALSRRFPPVPLPTLLALSPERTELHARCIASECLQQDCSNFSRRLLLCEIRCYPPECLLKIRT